MSASLPAPPCPTSEREDTAAFVLSLRERGVMSRAVLRAMETVPRQAFAPRRFADLARSDVALPLAGGQTMTAPAVVAAMLAALDLRPGQRVLEVGTGSGYVTALLAAMGAEVHSVERSPALLGGAILRLEAAGRLGAVTLHEGCGLGAPPVARLFDRILLNGSVADLPDELTAALGPAGRLVGAAADPAGPRLFTLSRDAEGALAAGMGARLRIGPLAPRSTSRKVDEDRARATDS